MRAYRKVKEHYEWKIDGSRLALLGVGAALVLVLVFLLGVLVGKSLWGGRRPAPLPVAEAPRQRPEETAPRGEQRPDLSFYDDLRKPDAPSTERPPAAPPPAPVAETPVPVRPDARAAPAESPPAAPPEPKAAPKPEPRPEPKAALPAPVFTVQVGSFRDRSSAEDLVRRVAAQGVTAQIVPASVAGRTWFRVQVGRFDTRAEAESLYRKTLQPKSVQGFVTTR